MDFDVGFTLRWFGLSIKSMNLPQAFWTFTIPQLFISSVGVFIDTCKKAAYDGLLLALLKQHLLKNFGLGL